MIEYCNEILRQRDCKRKYRLGCLHIIQTRCENQLMITWTSESIEKAALVQNLHLRILIHKNKEHWKIKIA
ncbi:hypothetical protein SADUNF_Sadunf12G0054300 [Salix dunnii]|uniref:Uncharacterized protein n=1 Tax=Salix dunnii TaxID=1413687 RepID=A0A835JKR0_9ROSI|nr:hypothetical protein SADUNF_Sadunf12G0054300 [Salix dunnii]